MSDPIPTNTKYIREARMGPPKAFKTGAVVGTYPKPLLYFGFDRGGLDVIPSKPATGNDIKMNVLYPDIRFVEPNAFQPWLLKPMSEQPKILAVQFSDALTGSLSMDFKPSANSIPLQNFIGVYNLMVSSKPPLPWKTIVLDSVTGFTDVVLNHISAFNPNAMTDARQWASMAGAKVRQTVISITGLPAHVVVLLHSFIEKNEITQEIRELPNVYSQVLRDDFFGLFSQVFYATQVNGLPKLWVSDRYPVKGIGPRWPRGLASEITPDFNTIYGNELGNC